MKPTIRAQVGADPVIYRILTKGFNPGSSQQCATIVYDVLKAPSPRDPRVGRRSTGKGALLDLLHVHPIVGKIMKFRRIAKLKSAYLDSFTKALDENSRVHCTIWIPGTETGRVSTREGPPLQTIPRANDKEEGQYGRIIKDCVAAGPGRVLVAVDSSQSELRVAAEYSQEPFLLTGFQDPDWDLHTATTIELYGPNYKREEREACKEITFGFLYGGSEASLIITIVRRGHTQIPIEQAKAIVTRHAQVMSGLYAWRSTQRDKLAMDGYVATPTGRRRRFAFINELNQDEARKSAVNSPIQGLSSDITIISLIELAESGVLREFDAIPVMTVHDSIMFEVPDIPNHIRGVKNIVEAKIIEVAGRYIHSVPWKVETKVGKRWGSLEKLP